MAKKPGVDTKVTMGRKDPRTNENWDFEGFVQYSIGGNQLNDQRVRDSLDVTMRGTMEMGDKILGQLLNVKAVAQAALDAGKKKIPEIENYSRGPKNPEKLLANLEEGIGDPNTRKTFSQWKAFQRMINSDGWQMGHGALAVATVQTAAYLSANLRAPLGGDPNNPEQLKFREELRKLYLAQKELDALTLSDWTDAQKKKDPINAGVVGVLKKLEKLEDGFDISTTLERDIDMAKGKSDQDAFMAFETTEFNQWKKDVGAKITRQVREMWTTQAATELDKSLVGGIAAYTRGSKTMIQILEEQVIDIAVKGGAKKYAKKTKSTTRVGKKIKGVKQHKKKVIGLQNKLKKAASDLAAVKVPSSTGQANAGAGAGSQQTDLQLLTLLKAKLPQTVAQNMGPPGLVNRTGRFASSVTPTDVSRTAQGYPSVGYTYRKNPYQVFEMGVGDARWATPDRDPRKVIDMSIREIAAQLVVGRLYTRRQ